MSSKSDFAGLEYFFGDGVASGTVSSTLSLASTAFNDKGDIPVKYAGPGGSPSLAWSNAPPETKSFALIMEDTDAAFTHWMLYDLPGDATGLAEGAGEKGKLVLDNGARQAKNDFDYPGYGGPSPPPGNAHHYIFTLYTLDDKLGLTGTIARPQRPSRAS